MLEHLFCGGRDEKRIVSDLLEEELLSILDPVLWKEKTVPVVLKSLVINMIVGTLWKGFETTEGTMELEVGEDTLIHTVAYVRRVAERVSSSPNEVALPSEMAGTDQVDNARLLTTTCALLADKVLNDVPLSLKAWAGMAGLTAEQLIKAEASLASAMGYTFPVDTAYVLRMREELETRRKKDRCEKEERDETRKRGREDVPFEKKMERCNEDDSRKRLATEKVEGGVMIEAR